MHHLICSFQQAAPRGQKVRDQRSKFWGLEVVWTHIDILVVAVVVDAIEKAFEQ